LQLFAIEFTSLSTEGGARECFGVSIVPPVIKFKSIKKPADSGNKKLPERLVLTVSRHFCLTVEQSVFHRFGLTSHWKLGHGGGRLVRKNAYHTTTGCQPEF